MRSTEATAGNFGWVYFGRQPERCGWCDLVLAKVNGVWVCRVCDQVHQWPGQMLL